MRANNDLVIFAVLAVALVALRAATWGRLVLAVVAVAAAIGFKILPGGRADGFPAGAAVSEDVVGGGCGGAGRRDGAGLGRGTGDRRVLFILEPEIYTMGARILLTDLGLAEISLDPWRWPCWVPRRRSWSGAAGRAAWLGMTRRLTPGSCRWRWRQRCWSSVLGHGELRLPLDLCVVAGSLVLGEARESGAARLMVWLLPAVYLGRMRCCAWRRASWFPDLGAAQYERIFLV